LAYAHYRQAYALARQQQEVGVALHLALQEEAQLRYNGMLASVWDLLASAQDRLQSQQAALQALRDFWLAHLDLQAVLAGLDPNHAANLK
jgi:outer membrane protein TolC